MDAFAKLKDPLIGTRLDGRYMVTGVLGRGGMGVVYEGMHETLGRSVAIKVLSEAIATEGVVVQRFLREARIAAGLGHGNIVDVSDLGRLPDGRPYLVMPRIIGISFSDLLAKRGPQSPARVVELLRGVASALDLVHAKGLVHRDVKPENLMFVVRDDGSETVMLMDFGIAVLVSPNAARLTGEGVVCGTPAYLSPESARGEDADHRADVYALATVAFELMTGELPFDADNPLKILPMKAFRDPPRLAQRSDRAFPDALETVLARGLARVPEERFETAGAFVSALELAINPAAGRGSPQPDTQLFTPPKPPRVTESAELPAGSSDEIELEMAREESLSPGPSIEEMETQLTPRGSEAQQAAKVAPAAVAVPSSVPPPLPQSRRGLFAVIAASAFVVAGLLFALFGEEPLPGAPATPDRERARDIEVTPAAVTGERAAPAPAPAPAALPPAPAPEPAPAVAPSAPAQPALSQEPAPSPPPRTPSARPRSRTAPAGPKPQPEPRVPVASLPKPSAPAPSAPSGPSAEALNKQAGHELLQGHIALAADLYSEATARDPRSAAAWRGLGITSERLGRTAVAIRAYRRALQIAPTGPQADSVRERLEQLK